MTFSYDEIYGVNLDEYCKLHNTTVDDLIRKSNVDISILHSNLDVLLHKDLSHDEGYIIDFIFGLIKKKQDHIFKLEAWKSEDFKN